MNISNNLPEVIGLAGTFAAGKDTLAWWLVENHGFTHVSTGNLLREAAQERYGNIERPTLSQMGRELREENGPGVLASRALLEGRPIVISGIRAAGEAEAIKEAGGVMVFIDADPSVRYERMRTRARDEEAVLSYDNFMARERRELIAKDDPTDQNIGIVKGMSDIILDNSGEMLDFTNDAFNKLEQHSIKPTESE